MESAARRPPFHRSSLTKEVKKRPRLAAAVDPAAPDRSSSNGVTPGHQQQQQQEEEELVNQYRTALAELTFNSKPIITNLTIIAEENAHAAKAIAATVCANILEVPREQKLLSLYLLDSIVKNFGRDYIKHFATRLPEVFCKTYRQVDPSIHQGMRRLFGTWKGVFPPQTLQMIEKELGFTTIVIGSSSGSTSLRPDSQAQRPAPSIHVNPKYLEAKQRLQTNRASGVGNDISGALVSSHEDVEVPRRNSALSSERSLADPYSKVRVENMTYGSSVSGRLGLGTRRVSEEFKEQELDMPSYEFDGDATWKLSKLKNGFDPKHRFESYIADRAANSESHLQFKKNLPSRTANGMNRIWKNSEEEEFLWGEIKSRSTDKGAAKDDWTPDNSEKLGFDSHLSSPNIGSVVDEASTDSISTGMGQVPSAARFSTWSEDAGPGKNISGSSGGYSNRLKSSSNKVLKTSFQSQPGPTHGAPLKNSSSVMPGPKDSNSQQRQTLGAASSSIQSPLHHRPPSPSFSAYDPNQLLNNIVVCDQASSGPPTDPRRPPVLRNKVPRGQFSQGSMTLPSRNVNQSSEQRSGTQSLPPVSAATPPLQQRKDVPSTQKRKLDVSEFDSYGEGWNLMSSQISGSESSSTLANSSSDQFNPLTVDSSGQSLTSSLLSAVAKSGILCTASLLSSSAELDFQEVGCSSAGSVKLPLPSGPNSANLLTSLHIDGRTLLQRSSKEKLEQQPLPTGASHLSLVGSGSEQTPSAVNSPANPVSSLLSTLVAKGLISASKPDSLFPASIPNQDQPLDRDPGVASTSSTPISADPVTVSKPHTNLIDDPSSSRPAAKPADGLAPPATKIKNIIGFDFKPHIVRHMHPDVISDILSDLPHQCIICGLRLQFREQFDRHMEWHALKVPELNPLNKTSRRWFANSEDWVSGVGHWPLDPLGESGEALEESEQMVTADESQCACILCGDLFEDFYCQERNEWVYKGAIPLTIPSSGSHERSKTMSDTSALGPLVHVSCMSEDSVRALGLACDVKLEMDP